MSVLCFVGTFGTICFGVAVYVAIVPWHDRTPINSRPSTGYNTEHCAALAQLIARR